ncbi:MAG TPA: ABC transporter ATP-binding protein [Chloroflexaceae bacterium]|nr:ABC transporter ATP-binding protein [Chloroflexaceae bacterium]
MGDIAVRVTGVSKQYHLGQLAGWDGLGETLAGVARDPAVLLRALLGKGAHDKPTIWSLRDVSFDVRHGEVVGIIGRNGAGKSTLLKILSGITAPTRGRVELYGRVGSLLEVGTGFHPELTGRENIYLSGAILGMRRAEIRRKFDEIVAFAEISAFLDTPVKRYSSGMHVRLAFAVAAHLEPEILIVDEVLAVGDAAFQKKCLAKMEGVSQEGRTVLFVSHSMAAITRLCPRALLLHGGRLIEDAPSSQVIGSYLSSGAVTPGEQTWEDPRTAPQGEVARLRAVRVRAEDGRVIDSVDIRQPLRVELEFDVLKDGYLLMPSFQFFTHDGVHAFSAHDIDPEWRGRRRPRGCYVSTVEVPGNLFSEGTMFVNVGLEVLEPAIRQFYEHDAVAFQVLDSLDGNSARGDYVGEMSGAVRPLLPWHTRFTPAGADHA